MTKFLFKEDKGTKYVKVNNMRLGTLYNSCIGLHQREDAEHIQTSVCSISKGCKQLGMVKVKIIMRLGTLYNCCL